jgi:hypothetical protein
MMIGDFPHGRTVDPGPNHWPSQLAQPEGLTVTVTVSLATVVSQVVRVTMMMMMLCPPAARVTVPVPGWTGSIDSERGGARTPARVFCHWQCQLWHPPCLCYILAPSAMRLWQPSRQSTSATGINVGDSGARRESRVSLSVPRARRRCGLERCRAVDTLDS